jgi:hypothetical protein
VRGRKKNPSAHYTWRQIFVRGRKNNSILSLHLAPNLCERMEKNSILSLNIIIISCCLRYLLLLLLFYLQHFEIRRNDRQDTEVKHTQILFLFGSSINLYSATRLLLPLAAGRIVFVCIGCCRVTLASVTLFGSGSSIGSGTRCSTLPSHSFPFGGGLMCSLLAILASLTTPSTRPSDP